MSFAVTSHKNDDSSIPPPRTHSPKGPILRFTFPCVCLSVSLVPQQGELLITTEFGKMMVEPNEICVIQVRSPPPPLGFGGQNSPPPQPPL